LPAGQSAGGAVSLQPTAKLSDIRNQHTDESSRRACANSQCDSASFRRLSLRKKRLNTVAARVFAGEENTERDGKAWQAMKIFCLSMTF